MGAAYPAPVQITGAVLAAAPSSCANEPRAACQFPNAANTHTPAAACARMAASTSSQTGVISRRGEPISPPGRGGSARTVSASPAVTAPGDGLAGERLEYPDLRAVHGDQHGGADEPARHRIPGRPEPDLLTELRGVSSQSRRI
jgi:hypothetical protein